MNRPRRSILNPDFKYVPAASTDIRTTFARVRLEMKLAELKAARAAKPQLERKTK